MVKDRIKNTGKKAARKVGDYARERPAVTASFAMHVLLVFFVVVGMPLIWKRNAPPPPRTVNIDLLPIREKTNVKPQEEAPKPEEKKEEKPEPVKAAEPPVEKKPEPVPEKPKEKPKPVAKPKEKPKPPKEKPKPKPKEESWDDMAKGLLNDLDKKKSSKPKQEKQDAEYDPSEELSISEMDFIATTIRRQIEARWDIPAGARDASGMQVKLKFKVKADGTIYDVSIVDQVRYATDQVFRASADSALRAAYEASPLKDLPAKDYDFWKDNTITFDPSDMF